MISIQLIFQKLKTVVAEEEDADFNDDENHRHAV